MDALKVIQARREKTKARLLESATSSAKQAASAKGAEEGFLVKQGEKRKNWKKRFFKLQDTTLRWFDSEEDSRRGRSLGEIDIVAHSEGGEGVKQHVLTIKAKTGRLLVVRSDVGTLGLLTTIRERSLAMGPGTLSASGKGDRSTSTGTAGAVSAKLAGILSGLGGSSEKIRASEAKPAATAADASARKSEGTPGRERKATFVADSFIATHSEAYRKSLASHRQSGRSIADDDEDDDDGIASATPVSSERMSMVAASPSSSAPAASAAAASTAATSTAAAPTPSPQSTTVAANDAAFLAALDAAPPPPGGDSGFGRTPHVQRASTVGTLRPAASPPKADKVRRLPPMPATLPRLPPRLLGGGHARRARAAGWERRRRRRRGGGDASCLCAGASQCSALLAPSLSTAF